MAYKLVVKNGDTKYKYNENTGQYKSTVVDYIDEHEDLGSALYAFLEWVTDKSCEDKVSLRFTPDKKSKKN